MKKLRKEVKLLFIISNFLISMYFVSIFFNELQVTYDLISDINERQLEIEKAVQKNQFLEKEKSKFLDKEYLKLYIRGRYLITKENEKLYIKVK